MHVGLHARHEEAGAHRIGGLTAEHEGRGAGHGAFGILGVDNVPDELGEHAANIEIVGRFLEAHRRVVHPALTLVALGAVGEDVVLVGALGGHAQLVNLRHLRVAAAERGASLQIGVQLHRRDAPHVEARAETVDARIAEAVVGKDGLPDGQVSAVAAGDVGVRRLRAAQRLGEQRAVLIQLLGVAQADRLSLFQLRKLHAQHAREVLSEVQHDGVLPHRPRCQHRPAPVLDHGIENHRAHPSAGSLQRLRRSEAHEARAAPTDGRVVRIIGLAVEDVVGEVRAAAPLPLLIGMEPLRVAADVGHAEHGREDRMSGVGERTIELAGSRLLLRQMVAPPALAHHRADAVCAGLQVRGEIGIRHVLAGPAVVHRGGIQRRIVDGFAVDIQLLIADSAGVERRGGHRTVDGELPAQIDRAPRLVLRRADPAGLPFHAGVVEHVGVELALLARVIANLKRQRDGRSLGQRALIAQLLRPLLHPAAVPGESFAAEPRAAGRLERVRAVAERAPGKHRRRAGLDQPRAHALLESTVIHRYIGQLQHFFSSCFAPQRRSFSPIDARSTSSQGIMPPAESSL